MTKLQAALDMIRLEEAIPLVKSIEKDVDIVEVGTPFLIRYGLEVVRVMKGAFPALEILCDGKIMDAGYDEAESMFEAGADWVTVMACTDDATIAQCCQAARKAGGRVMADMLCVKQNKENIRRLEKLGVDCIAVHVGVDQQANGMTPLEALAELKACRPACMTAVAGGVSCRTAEMYLRLQPDILIVGGDILGAKDPAEAAQTLAQIIRNPVA